MPKQKLFDEESEEEVAIITENEYAKKYDKWRRKEELHKLEQKYGSKDLNSNGSGSSDSEDESDEPPEVSEEIEAQFLKTLALLKTKDPRIYDPGFKFFDENEKKEQEKQAKAKTLTFADSDDDDDEDGNIFSIEKKAEIVETDNKSNKTNQGNKEGKLKDYLVGKAEHLDDEVEKDLAPLKALWSDPKLNEGEAFLRDYILNKRYLEEGAVGEAKDKIRDDEDLEADEQRVEEQGQFERAYNFRFEEPDHEYLKRFPRTMNYIRPKDESRSRKRAEVRARKEQEKQRKMEEIARLKALKLKEIQDKIEKIKEVTGNEDLAFKEEDLASEFDPAEHDRRMQEIFDEHYYGDVDQHKPVFPELDEELEIENWEDYEPEHDEEGKPQGEDVLHCEDDDFNMDADYDPKQARQNLLEEMKRSLTGKKRRNRKKKSKLAQLLTTEKPKFVPTVAEKTYDEYMEEYYKMDCEDVIGGDLPTRFKYREVVPNDYGLTVEEILLADDKELTQWVPLKKVLKHRPDAAERGDANTYAAKAADVKLKKKILPSLFKHLPEAPEIVVPVEEGTKKKKKKNKKKQKEATDKLQEPIIEISDETRKHNGDTSVQADSDLDNTAESQENEEQNQEVKQKKKKKKLKTNSSNSGEADESNLIVQENIKEDSTKVTQIKKNKIDNFVVEDIEIAEPSIESTKKSKGNKKKNKDKSFSQDKSNETVQINSKKNNMNGNNESNSNKLKRKLSDVGTEQPSRKKNKTNKGNQDRGNSNKKMKSKQKEKFKKKADDRPSNPLTNLSDERLKAFGLNPKKYRGFLKYKKF